MELTAILKKAAPWLAAAAAGPAGLATQAIKTIADALGAPSDAAPDQLAVAIAGATPEQIKELKLAELNFKLRMQELGFKQEADLLKIAADDRDSARKAAVQGGTARGLFWMSVLLLVVCLSAEIAALFQGIPENVNELVAGRVLGLLDAVAMMVLTFNYGSSGDSRRKTDLLAQAEPVR